MLEREFRSSPREKTPEYFATSGFRRESLYRSHTKRIMADLKLHFQGKSLSTVRQQNSNVSSRDDS